MPRQTKAKKKENFPKIDPAPRDRSKQGDVNYPQTKEGGLNKYAKSEKDKRLGEAVDNLGIAVKKKHQHESASIGEILGVKFEASKLIWILINEDDEDIFIKLIASGLEYFKPNICGLQNLCIRVMEDKEETFKNDIIENFYDKTITSFVDNHKDLGDLLVLNTGDQMIDQIRTQLGNDNVALEKAFDDILTKISQDCPDEEIDISSDADRGPLEEDGRVMSYLSGIIKEITVEKLELPQKTPHDRESIVNALYRRCQTMAIKNMATKTSKISEAVKTHGEFIVEQVHANREIMLDTARSVLIIKDIDKILVDIKNIAKNKHFGYACTETRKFLQANGIQTESIVKISSYSERLWSIRVAFRNEDERNEADIKIRDNFNNHKIRTLRHQYNDFPGNVKPDLKHIKEVLLDRYNALVSGVSDDYKVDKATWDNFIKLTIIDQGTKNGKKNYIEFTDPTCPNYNVLVYNYEEDPSGNNPFVGFEFNEVIPNPKLRKKFDNDQEMLAYYAFKTYGLHTRRYHNEATWKKVESDWQKSGEQPPQVTSRRLGAASRNGL